MKKVGNPNAATPLPWGKIVVLCAVMLVNHFSQVMIFPFLPFLVKHLNPDLPDNQLGYRAGFMASAFHIGAFFGNIGWGFFSDRFGRRTAMLLGIVGTFCSVIVFGMSTTFAMALAARFFWGLLNGNIGVAKTYLSEICDDSNQARGYAAVGLSSSIGRLLGPILGGFLSQPAIQHPELFGDSLFLRKFPFVLPCFGAAFLCITSFIFGFLFLQETLQKKPKKLQRLTQVLLSERALSTQSDNGASLQSSARRQDFSFWKETVLCIVLYGLVAFSSIMVEEIFPLWALLPPSQKGLGFTSETIGLVMTLSAPFQVLSQLILFDRVVAKFGMMKVFKASILIACFSFSFVPYTTYLTDYPGALWTVLVILYTFMMIFRTFALTTVFVFVGNSCPSKVRGRVNGIGQSTAAVARVIGPIVAGSLFAFTASKQLPWPLDKTISFTDQILFGLITWFIARQIPESVERIRKFPSNETTKALETSIEVESIHAHDSEKSDSQTVDSVQ